MSVRVLLVDDQELVRAGFRLVLETRQDLEVVGEATDGEQALDAARRLRPDVVLMDVRMPVLDGIEATRRLVEAAQGPVPRVLILTTYDLDEYVFAALRAGASGFLLKHASPEELIAAVRTVAAGDGLLAPSVARRLIEVFARIPSAAVAPPRELALLTERERQILVLVARGLSNAEIAQRLFVGLATVKTHVGNMLMKLGLRDRIEAVIFAYEAGLVRPGG
jgi:DNA-binding NarL/FixJ family response regulator